MGLSSMRTARLVLMLVIVAACLTVLLPRLAGGLCNNLGMLRLVRVSQAIGGASAGIPQLGPGRGSPTLSAQLEAAGAGLSCALAWRSEYGPSYRNLGRVRAVQGEHVAAVEALHEATELRPDDRIAWFLLGRVYATDGLRSEAVEAWRQAKDSEWFFILEGSRLFGIGDLRGALENYEMAAMIAPGLSEVYYGMGRVYEQQMLGQMALPMYRRAVELDSVPPGGLRRILPDRYTKARAYHSIGEVLLSQGRRTEAIQAFEEAIASDPTDCRSYVDLGWVIYQQTGDLGRASEMIEVGLALNPEYILAYQRLSQLYRLSADYDKALTYADRAAAVWPESPHPFRIRGLIRFDQRDFRAALRDFTQAIAFDPSDTASQFWAGRTYLEMNLPAEAVRHCLRATELEPSVVPYHLCLGEAYAGVGQLGDAVAVYERVLELDPRNSTALRRLESLRGEHAGIRYEDNQAGSGP